MKLYKSINKLFRIISPKGFLLILLSAACVSTLIYLVDEHGQMFSFQGIRNNTYETKKMKNIEYDLNIRLDQFSINQMKEYKPIIEHRTEEEAIYYGGLFNIDSNGVETSEKYILENEKERVEVFKKIPLVHFTSKEEGYTNRKINEKQAVTIAEEFMKKTSLPNHYRIIQVDKVMKTNQYQISFINTLEGIPVYEYANRVVVSEDGDIIEMSYYDMKYEQTELKNIISMEEAYKRMIKSDGGIANHKIYIDIQKAGLVYRCTTDIKTEFDQVRMKTYYRFVGETNEGTSFERFIPATP